MNIAWRWPLLPMTSPTNVVESSMIGCQPGYEP
jgi:hypothetical protein